MSDPDPDWLQPLPAHLRPPLRRASQGGAPNVALMHLLMECSSPSEAEDALHLAVAGLRGSGDLIGAERLKAVQALAAENPDAFRVVRSIIGGLDHDNMPASGKLAYWADAFDRAARTHPNASVALYALGNPELLRAATDEIVAKLDEWGLISPETVCLDIGCGIGRFELALAPRVGQVVGIDIAPAMIETARANCAGLPNVEFRMASGRNLDGFAHSAFDLILAVDCFPYLVQAGEELTGSMLGEAVRVLRPAGHLVILNFSYRGDPARDRADMSAFAARFALDLARNGTPDFQLWDGASFVLRKP